MALNIKPLHDRVVVRRLPEEEVSAGGILIPNAAQEKPHQGEVVSVGSGKLMEDGSVRPMAVSTGDRVLFGKYSGTEVKLGSEELIVMREDDIMGIVQEA
jgi:chaperonin GroES